MRILAVDPGTVTGIADYDKQRGVFFNEVKGGVKGFVDAVRHSLPLYDVVVCESFVISPRTLRVSRVHDSLDIIGWLKGEEGYTYPELVMQTPAQAKQFATDDKLRRLGWYNATKDGHANDAARHLLTYLARAENTTFARMWEATRP